MISYRWTNPLYITEQGLPGGFEPSLTHGGANLYWAVNKSSDQENVPGRPNLETTELNSN